MKTITTSPSAPMADQLLTTASTNAPSAPGREARHVALNRSHAELHSVALAADQPFGSQLNFGSVNGSRVGENIVVAAGDGQHETVAIVITAQGSMKATSGHGPGAVGDVLHCTAECGKQSALSVAADQLLTAAMEDRQVGRQLASMSGIELDSIAPQDARLWDARGQALQALATGDMDAALRTMGLVSTRTMDRDEAWEIASNAVAVRVAAGWTRDMLDSSTESGRAPCGRGYYLFCSGAIAVCYFPMVCITDMNGRGYHFHIAQDLLNERDPSPYAIRRPTVPQQLELFR
ncbi:hypothetical protein [Stenotrophomonas maltophilia]|uniref:hypothetical protein n=1 Tax=Stenotrophomonas maltophilia TaxID=40324 RepID=UPI0015EC5135|nr:hypothetical protein [Stenotrophomonas maltophilia]